MHLALIAESNERCDVGRPGVRTVQQGAEIIVRLATLPNDGPTAGFFDDAATIPW
jgi:hypothetical protein